MRRVFLFLWLAAFSAVGLAEPMADLWVQTTPEYQACCLQTYNLATRNLDDLAKLLEKDAQGRACLPGTETPVAIVMDLDETVIDNSGFQAFSIQTGTRYSDDLWLDWMRFQAQTPSACRAVPGAVEYIAHAQSLGLTPVFISNRQQEGWDDTRILLETLKINTDNLQERMLLKLSKAEETARARALVDRLGLDTDSQEALEILQGEGSKETRRRLIAEKFAVAGYFGDMLSDFTPYLKKPNSSTPAADRAAQAERYKRRWGNHWYVLPNPTYGYWAPGQTLSAEHPEQSLDDFGFAEYLKKAHH